MKISLALGAVAFALMLVDIPAAAGRQADASRGCTTYLSGVRFMNEGKYLEALKEFQTVATLCTQDEIKAQAYLQSGYTYLRMWPPQYVDARNMAAVVVGKYLTSASGPDGHILGGRIELAENRNFENALNQFRRVNKDINAAARSIAEAEYYAAETLRIAHRFDEALRSFRDVTLHYPQTAWAAKAFIGLASCYIRRGDEVSAMEALQRVRRTFPDLPEATLALKRNTILHRLAMRGQSQVAKPIRTLGPAGAYEEAAGLTFDPAGRLIVGHRGGLAILSIETGQQVASRPLPGDSEAYAVGIAPGGFPALARNHDLLIDRNPVGQFRPGVPQREGSPEALEINAFATNWKGEWLVADRNTNAIHRYSPDGDRHLGTFATNVSVKRMIQNDIDDAAVVNDRTKTVVFYSRDGKVTGEVPRRVTEQYDWDNPADIAFDGLGNLYVLDGNKAAIHAFDASLRFRTTIQLPVKGPPPLKKAYSLVVDDSGRIYVLDRDSQQILVFQ